MRRFFELVEVERKQNEQSKCVPCNEVIGQPKVPVAIAKTLAKTKLYMGYGWGVEVCVGCVSLLVALASNVSWSSKQPPSQENVRVLFA